jgi:sugar lactone lactonase YvrE
VICFLGWPSPISSISYDEPGINEKIWLKPVPLFPGANPIGYNMILSSEDIAFDKNGAIFTGDRDKILKITFDKNNQEKISTFVETGGQNLGLCFDNENNLISANNGKGLLKIDKKGRIENLLKYYKPTNTNNTPGYPNAVTVSKDGVIYFSDSSARNYGSPQSYYYDLLEARPTGRLLAFYPKSKEFKVLLDNLKYANGVALSKNEDFILVNETYAYRILKYYLKGKNAGTTEIFADGLNGFPDGVSADEKGNFYVAVFSPRSKALSGIQKYPFIKDQLAKLPEFLRPKPKKISSALKFDQYGKCVKAYQDNTKNIYSVSSVRVYNDFLYIGTLKSRALWRFPLIKSNSSNYL